MHAKFQENQKIFVGVIALYMQFLSNFEIQCTFTWITVQWITISVIFKFLKLYFLKANGSKESLILLGTLYIR